MNLTYHFLTLVVLLCSVTAALELPGVEWLTNKFWSTDKKVKEPASSSRTKRQNPNIGDESQLYYEARSSTLPTVPNNVSVINFRYMPTLSNGLISFTPYDDTVYMNGLYSGTGGQSHRTKIPAVIMGKIYLGSEVLERGAHRQYIMNAQEGFWMETIQCDFGYIEHKIYPHQFYNRLLVVSIYATRRSDYQGGGYLYLKYPSFHSNEDISFTTPGNYYSTFKSQGTTIGAEEGEATQQITVYFQYADPVIPVVAATNITFVMAMDRQDAAARAELDIALNLLDPTASKNGHYELFLRHQNAWRKTWERGQVLAEGDVLIPKLIQFSQYYILSQLPAIEPYQPAQISDFLYGVGRGSLGHGERGKDYQGHIFWDSEMYIFLALLPIHADRVKFMLRYRAEKREKAMEIAKQYGQQGLRYPWEGGRSGYDVTPDGTCDHCRDRQIHVSGAVSFAIRQYFSMTRDMDYLQDQYYDACDVTRDIAKFYAEKAVYDTTTGRYSINDVVGPDDRADHVNNNAYTNVIASLAIHWGRYQACMCRRTADQEVPDEYLMKALYMHLPYDNARRLHYQFDNFEAFRQANATYRVKQADTVLLGYPLNWNMSRDIWRNDLEYYENQLDSRTPAMTKSFMVVGWKFVDDPTRVQTYFDRSYQDYIIQPFKVWTEYTEGGWSDQLTGTVNFLPGMGGFLQSIVYGFVGLRIRPEQLEFNNPIPPPSCSAITLNGLDYMFSNMSIRIERAGQGVSKAIIIVTSVSTDFPLVLVRNTTTGKGPEQSMRSGEMIQIDNAQLGFYIYSTQGSPCEHPRDYIYMPWGYSPWFATASHITVCYTCILTAFTILLCHWLQL